MDYLIKFLNELSDWIYSPLLIILLLGVGLYFTFRTKAIQLKNLKESFRVIAEKPVDEGDVSSFQALMVSTASRVGTGNIVGVSTAICLGGPGAVFWMWVVALIGGASAFVESTLAQIYKKRGWTNHSYGGPSYYIEAALKNRRLGVIFSICLILTYAVGFNMLAAFNLADSFKMYDFYHPTWTPTLVGLVLAFLTGYCVLGGGGRIIRFTSLLVPVMGFVYVAVSLVMVLVNLPYIPTMMRMIFKDAFDFQAITSGLAGSSLVYGIKRGLFSNEAGIGSAPNAAAAANVSHPVKQGLVQMVSVFIDTILICSATAFMCLSSQVIPSEKISGAPYVQMALSSLLGHYGYYFITFALMLFGFTTLIGNLYYVDNNLTYIFGKQPSGRFMIGFRILAALVIFVGATQKADLVWTLADLMMALMALINLPSILALSRIALASLSDYREQISKGKNPVFKAKSIGLDDSSLDYWK
ncbi:alanine:cation symporter family protein [Atopobacter sp. AH10]|uniref:alanine/glycine:cation symporter family protein n=1 Tax=Atopobacter sp. AH10 TaxID=2315861 RepID=UPI000EF27E75|nr:alanine/glycine:cation symporter family protein [Atopobacter sp. AH10]RLK63047.1 alanine:cation symporter family protein [Atopobacter sp. AH10]